MGHDENQSPFIQHHFDGAKHQFDSGKLGIWAFLVQEILFFSALFVAYVIYRVNHPELFYYANSYLDTTMGAINTAVLIISSLTAAWAVRCAQLGQKKGLVLTLAVTILCAFGFLTIKYFEYSHKIHDGILYGAKFAPVKDHKGRTFTFEQHVESAAATHWLNKSPDPEKLATYRAEYIRKYPKPDPKAVVAPPNTNMFFSIYFAMTGLHGIHVLAGIFVFIWLLWRAQKGHFGPDYFGPIDYAALYWHLVDLIWIFLFPMLYLIH